MTKQTDLASSFTLPGWSMTVNRMGYGCDATRLPSNFALKKTTIKNT